MYKIYVLSDGTAHKIGFAKDFKQRLRIIQVGNPNKLKVVALIDVPAAFNHRASRFIESKAHRRWKHRAMQGEWFKLSNLEASEAVQLITRDIEISSKNGILKFLNNFTTRRRAA